MVKTNIGLVEHSEKILSQKAGYVWGTFCTKLTENLYNQKLRQYPSGVGNYKTFIRDNYMGKIVSDCIGLVKGYLFTDINSNVKYNPTYDMSADMMFKRASKKGSISTIPEIKGLCVRFKGHVGIYIGDGEVIEAKGTKYGVVKTNLKNGRWTDWYECPYIDYIKEENNNIRFLGKEIRVDSLIIETGISKVEVRDLFESIGMNVGYVDGVITVDLK